MHKNYFLNLLFSFFILSSVILQVSCNEEKPCKPRSRGHGLKRHKRQRKSLVESKDISDYIYIPILNILNEQYNIEVGLGSQNQTASLGLNTLSTSTWTCSWNTYEGNTSNSDSFSCDSSNTCVVQNKAFVDVQDGLTGTFIRDSMKLLDDLVLENAGVLLVNQPCDELLFPGYSQGNIGLGLNSQGGTNTFLWQLKLQKYIVKVAFSLYLSTANAVADMKSTLVLGGLDPKYLLNPLDIDYFPMKDNKYAIPLVSWRLDAVQPYVPKSTRAAALDTNQNMIYMPSDDFRALVANFKSLAYDLQYDNNTALYTIKCEKETFNTTLPVLTFAFANDQSKLVFLPLPPERYFVVLDDVCQMLISNNEDVNDDSLTLGLPFLRQYYSLYDLENRKIGLGQANPNPLLVT